MEKTLLHQAFFSQAKMSPERTAIVDQEETLTYDQLRKKVIHYASVIQQQCTVDDPIIALHCHKNHHSVAIFLAIATLGGRCVQLDSSFPQPLLSNILQETKAHLLISDNPAQFDEKLSCKLYTLTELIDNPWKVNEEKIINSPVDSRKPLWLVYSSGTTGKHKGIAISHQAMTLSYQARYRVVDYNETSKVACNIYFFWEVFRPLLKGGCVYIIDDDLLHDFARLISYIGRHDITEILFTPSFLEVLLFADCLQAKQLFSYLDICWLNGETVSKYLYKKLLPYSKKTSIYNLYSVSECHDVAAYKLSEKDKKIIELEGFVPVGYPLNTVKVLTLDNQTNKKISNKKGELYVSSPFLAEGYIERPELNKERFVFIENNSSKQKFYKSSDYALQLSDGLLFIYGRCDYLVKLRGYTVSLPFVESVLKDKLNCHQCIVRKNGLSVDEYLEVYLEVSSDQKEHFQQYWQLDNQGRSQKILQAVSPYLATYMRPRYFHLVNSIAINNYSNKLDRNNIKNDDPYHAAKSITSLSTLSDYRDLWSRLLKIPLSTIKNDSCFFSLGGTSLTAAFLISKTRQLKLSPITLKDLLTYSTLENSFRLLNRKHSLLGHSVHEIIAKDINEGIKNIKDQDRTFSKKINFSLYSKENSAVFLTGSTGFFGGYLLKNILIKKITVNCLVRAESKKHAYQRLQQRLARLNFNLENYKSLLNIHIGNITQPFFGWSEKYYQLLAQETCCVIHAAAQVNLLLPYSVLKSSCLDSTQQIINFSLITPEKKIHHISTNGIFSKEEKQPLSESVTSLETVNTIETGYGQAKWAAEQLIIKSQKLFNLQGAIYRPGNLMPDKISGDKNEKDLNFLIMQEIHAQRSVPDILNMEMTPASHVAEFIFRRALTDDPWSIFNVVSPHRISAELIASEFHYPIISHKKWLTNIYNIGLKELLSDLPELLTDKASYCQENYFAYSKKASIKIPCVTVKNLF